MRSWLERAAKEGDEIAPLHLGDIHFKGLGVPRDVRKAVRWYRMGVRGGNATARTRLGVLYRDGDGVPRDLAKARERFEKAAEEEETEVWRHLGGLCLMRVPPDCRQARKWYRRAADFEDEISMHNLALLFLRGLGGARNRRKAMDLLERAAELGHDASRDILNALEAMPMAQRFLL